MGKVTHNRKQLLVIDWDYFTPVKESLAPGWPLYDWGHQESPVFIDGPAWQYRTADFLR